MLLLSLYNKKNSNRTNSERFFLSSLPSSSSSLIYLHFYTIIRIMVVRTSKSSKERECGIYRKEKREKESEYRISYTHIALCVMWAEKRDRKRKESNGNKSRFGNVKRPITSEEKNTRKDVENPLGLLEYRSSISRKRICKKCIFDRNLCNNHR